MQRLALEELVNSTDITHFLLFKVYFFTMKHHNIQLFIQGKLNQ